MQAMVKKNKKIPVTIRKIIGDLSNEEKVLVGLNLKPLN